MALEIAAGHYPFPGDYRDQPETVQEFRLMAVEAREAAVSLGAKMGVLTAGKAKRGR